MRGTRGTIKGEPSAPGITPAYAGNTSPPSIRKQTYWDHPRVCGEHKYTILRCKPFRGSPPRMRGTHIKPTSQNSTRGITPAYAGNTSSRKKGSTLFRDHPRVCGEHTHEKSISDAKWGSPPRMRGTLDEFGGKSVGVGITPAYAGNTIRIYCDCWF